MNDSLSKARILIVDDDKQVQQIFSAMISGGGYLPEVAGSAEEAFAKTGKFLPDLILLDVVLPDINGIEVCKRLRADANTRAIPIIAITGYGDNEVKMKCLEAGANDFLSKPVDYAELGARIKNLLVIGKFGHVSLKNEILLETIAAVEAAKNEWEVAMDGIDDIVLLIDSQDRIVRCNRILISLAGRTYPEILKAKWRTVLEEAGFVPDDREPGGPEYRFGNERCFQFKCYPIKKFGGDGGGYSVITLKDVTELKLAEQKLRQAYDELKAAQSRILQQDKMASIGQLAAGVAHEINNPMGYIMSNLGSLEKYVGKLREFILFQQEVINGLASGGPVPELEENRRKNKIDHIMDDSKQLLAESLEGADRIKKIVQGLKEFAHVDEAGYEWADINSGIESTIRVIWNELKYKAVLKKELGDIPMIKCNLGQLNQVFMNILVNAAHAIEKQGEITVKTWFEDGYVHISITDTGCGIPPDNILRVFEPFFTTKEVGKGTGLGLSIAYDIVKKHDGDLTVTSEVGRGTTFTLSIPAARE